MIRRPPRSTPLYSSAASDVYKRQPHQRTLSELLSSAEAVAASHQITVGGVVRTPVQAFVSCRLDYCNSLLVGMTDDLFQRLQGIQNAAACLVTGTGRRQHITPVLRQLHWLPVPQRVEFKLVLLIHKSLLGQLPPYLADDCQLIMESGHRTLLSSNTATFVIPTHQH